MSDTPSFGDFDLDDAYCAEGDPDPEQAARKLHQIRVELTELRSETLTPWDDLDDGEREVAVAIAEYGVAALTGLDTSAYWLAESIHGARAFFNGEALLSELSGEDQAVARSIAAMIIEWLSRQGALR